MQSNAPRVAVRAVLVHEDRLLMVNAYADRRRGLMCAPGGGVDIGQSLPDNLAREVFEETGLRISVGLPCLINEFHDPPSGFHQVEIFFRCSLKSSDALDPAWRDSEDIVTERRWVSRAELADLPHKPGSLAQVAFGADGSVTYDPLELIVR